MSTRFPGGAPAVPYIRLTADGDPSLSGSRCRQCRRVLLSTPRACSGCGGRELEPIRLAEQGRLHTGTIVQRSFPGVRTPFIAVVVDLDGGGSIKGTLIDASPDPGTLASELRVRVVFADSGQRDEQGRSFIAYHFVPIGRQPA